MFCALAGRAANEDGKYCHCSGKEKSATPVRNRAFAFGRQFRKNMFGVAISSDALRSFLHQETKKPLAALVE